MFIYLFVFCFFSSLFSMDPQIATFSEYFEARQKGYFLDFERTPDVKACAENGNPKAQYVFAQQIKQSGCIDAALDLLERSAQKNYLPAQYEYAEILLPTDPSQALEYFKKAAVPKSFKKQGITKTYYHMPSIKKLMHLYATGENGVQKELSIAKEYADLARQAGDVAAYNDLMLLCEKHEPETVAEFQKLSTDSDFLSFQGSSHIRKGNYDLGLDALLEAAEKKEPNHMYNLGWFYMQPGNHFNAKKALSHFVSTFENESKGNSRKNDSWIGIQKLAFQYNSNDAHFYMLNKVVQKKDVVSIKRLLTTTDYSVDYAKKMYEHCYPAIKMIAHQQQDQELMWQLEEFAMRSISAGIRCSADTLRSYFLSQIPYHPQATLYLAYLQIHGLDGGKSVEQAKNHFQEAVKKKLVFNSTDIAIMDKVQSLLLNEQPIEMADFLLQQNELSNDQSSQPLVKQIIAKCSSSPQGINRLLATAGFKRLIEYAVQNPCLYETLISQLDHKKNKQFLFPRLFLITAAAAHNGTDIDKLSELFETVVASPKVKEEYLKTEHYKRVEQLAQQSKEGFPFRYLGQLFSDQLEEFVNYICRGIERNDQRSLELFIKKIDKCNEEDTIKVISLLKSKTKLLATSDPLVRDKFKKLVAQLEKKNSSTIQYFLYELCKEGLSGIILPDEDKAKELLQQAAHNGSHEALIKIAQNYESGLEGFQKSLDEAARYYYELHSKVHDENGKQQLLRLATEDNLAAWYYTFVALYETDPVSAIQYLGKAEYSRSAQKDNFDISLFVKSGAYSKLVQLAKTNNELKYLLGLFTVSRKDIGFGIDKISAVERLKQGVKYIDESLSNGYIPEQKLPLDELYGALAQTYQTEKNFDLAIEYYQKAAMINPNYFLMLDSLCRKGFIHNKNVAELRHNYLYNAAHADSVDALRKLAKLYWRGPFKLQFDNSFVPQNRLLACTFLERAIGLGCQKSKEVLDQITRENSQVELPDTALARGLKCYNEFRYEDALIEFTKASDQGNTLADTYIGIINAEQQNVDVAFAYFIKVLENKASLEREKSASGAYLKKLSELSPRCGYYSALYSLKNDDVADAIDQLGALNDRTLAREDLALLYSSGCYDWLVNFCKGQSDLTIRKKVTDYLLNTTLKHHGIYNGTQEKLASLDKALEVIALAPKEYNKAYNAVLQLQAGLYTQTHNYQEAFNKLSEIIKRDPREPHALTDLGRLYLTGKISESNVNRSIAKAENYLINAADQGNIIAMKSLADLYLDREVLLNGVKYPVAYPNQKQKEKQKKAKEYLQKIIESTTSLDTDKEIQDLSLLKLAEQEFAEKNYDKSIELFSRHISKGFLKSNLWLGIVYNAKGDFKKAFETFSLPCGESQRYAYLCMAKLYLNGNMQSSQPEEAALELVEKALDSNEGAFDHKSVDSLVRDIALLLAARKDTDSVSYMRARLFPILQERKDTFNPLLVNFTFGPEKVSFSTTLIGDLEYYKGLASNKSYRNNAVAAEYYLSQKDFTNACACFIKAIESGAFNDNKFASDYIGKIYCRLALTIANEAPSFLEFFNNNIKKYLNLPSQ